jgi:hypothetical protein
MNFPDFAFLLDPQGKRFSTHANLRHSAISDGNPVAMLSCYVLILSKDVWVNSREREW